MKPHSIETRDQAAALVASGRSLKSVASECNIGLRTLHGWMADDDDFRGLVSRYRDRLVARTLGRLSAVATRAVAALADCLRADQPGSVRVTAARTILDSLTKYREHAELAARLVEVEDKLAQSEGEGGLRCVAP